MDTDRPQMSVNDLPAELIARIFEKLEDKERCQTIPLLSKSFHQIDKDYPPRPGVLVLTQPVTQAMVAWFLRIAPTLEKLEVTFPEDTTGFLTQLLAMAAVTAPRLQSLDIGELWTGANSPVMNSLLFLTQIKDLYLCADSGAGDSPISSLGRLSSLRSLEEAEISLCPASMTAEGAADMWDAWSKLKKLRQLILLLYMPDKLLPDYLNRGTFLRYISRLTQIRHLDIEDVHLCLNNRGMIPEGVAALTQLTSLAFESGNVSDDYRYHGLPGNAIPPAFYLPCLRELRLAFEREGPASLGPLRHCRQLTFLSLWGGNMAVSADQMLPDSAAFLPSLAGLEVSLTAVWEFPSCLAEALTSLAYLDLSCNQFDRIPTAISRISSLQKLMMNDNPQLQLHPSDVETLVALPRLKKLVLDPESGNVINPEARAHQWSGASKDVLAILMNRRPGLAIALQH